MLMATIVGGLWEAMIFVAEEIGECQMAFDWEWKAPADFVSSLLLGLLDQNCCWTGCSANFDHFGIDLLHSMQRPMVNRKANNLKLK